MTTFVGISRDHSVSMSHIVDGAMRDFNSIIRSLHTSAEQTSDLDVRVSVIECGSANTRTQLNALNGKTTWEVHVDSVNRPLSQVKFMTDYRATGGSTPLRDSVIATIEAIQQADIGPDDKCIVLVTTDGQENSSNASVAQLRSLVDGLSKTGQWTFVARVPRGSTKAARSLGFPEGNILEWDTTTRGQEAAASTTSSAMTSFMSSGVRSTSTFFANLEDVTVEEVKANLVDISDQVEWLLVEPKDVGTQIRDFVEAKRGKPMLKGAAHYALVKVEPKVQDNKRIIIREKATGAVYAGDAARQMLALPRVGTVRLRPDDLGDFEVYIQSTSVNRKVDAGTRVLYWEGVGIAYKEGKSAQ